MDMDESFSSSVAESTSVGDGDEQEHGFPQYVPPRSSQRLNEVVISQMRAIQEDMARMKDDMMEMKIKIGDIVHLKEQIKSIAEVKADVREQIQNVKALMQAESRATESNIGQLRDGEEKLKRACNRMFLTFLLN